MEEGTESERNLNASSIHKIRKKRPQKPSLACISKEAKTWKLASEMKGGL